jgi:hypothetical protein
MKINRDFRELLECFVSHDVRFLVVGGHALAALGLPRYTKDMDIWVWMDPANAAAAVAAVEDFGFGGLGIASHDFVTPDVVIQLGYPPNRVDLLTSPSGVDFDECWSERLDVDLDGIVIPFIGPRGLMKNKAAAGRPQDLVDLGELVRRYGPA